MNRKGFTLIELMVTVSIIAILATIGVTVYIGTQRGARDAARRTDINNFIKALETKRGSTITNYGGLVTSATDFSSNVLPRDATGTTIYCASPTGTATTPTVEPTINWLNTCPAGYVSVDNTSYIAPSNTTQVRICAWLEQTNTAFCRATAQ